MSQPPYYNFNHPQQHQNQQYHQQQQQYQQSPQYYHQPVYSQQHNFMQQMVPIQQSYPMSPQQSQLPPKPTHWFDRMCEVISTQQSRHEAGSPNTPPMLTPGNYIQWASRFLRFIELKKPNGKYMKTSYP